MGQDIQPVRDCDINKLNKKAKHIYLKALKKKQKDLIIKIIKEDEKDGLYNDQGKAE